MSDERLSVAIEAFRDEHRGDCLDATAIRRRMLASHLRQPKRVSRLAWLLPAAILLLGSAALAANRTASPRLARVLTWLDRSVPDSRSSAPARSASLGARSTMQSAPVDLPPALGPTLVDEPPPPMVPTTATPSLAPPLASDAIGAGDLARSSLTARSRPASARKLAAPAAPRVETAANAEGAAPPPAASSRNDATEDIARYRTAHRLHFDDHDPARALTAWDGYLAAFPNGKLAIEAAFNRALCLIKLGRTAEAEIVLDRFAAGAFDGYRRTQAADLLASLRRRRAEP